MGRTLFEWVRSLFFGLASECEGCGWGPVCSLGWDLGSELGVEGSLDLGAS